VLAMPLKNVDLSVKLPPGLQLAATPAGHLDCRMQLMSLQMDWPATGKQVLVATLSLPCQVAVESGATVHRTGRIVLLMEHRMHALGSGPLSVSVFLSKCIVCCPALDSKQEPWFRTLLVSGSDSTEAGPAGLVVTHCTAVCVQKVVQ
jgi:hypothetical protein